MADAPTSVAREPRVVRAAWVWGGALLTVGALVALTASGGPYLGWLSLVASALAGAGYVVLAVGRDSVVARRPLGVGALVLLAAWPFVVAATLAIEQRVMTGPDGYAAASLATAGPPAWMLGVGYAEQLVPAVAALIAAVQVMRAGVVPPVLRRVPLFAVGLAVIPQVILQAVFVAFPHGDVDLFVTFERIAGLLGAVAVVGVGVCAIAAALRPRS